MSIEDRDILVAETGGDLLFDWLRATAIPFWSSTAWDAGRGGFVEQTDAEGRPDFEAPRRLRVQARQIHVMAEAEALGLAETRPAAFRGLDYLLAHGRAAGGRPGYPHMLHGDGSVCDARRDCYDHAFVLIALASVFKISRDAQIAGLIDEVVQFLDSALVSTGGGYLEGEPHAGPRRQNPHMHLFEAFIGLYEATGNPDYATRAAALLDFITGRFLHGRDRLLLEVLDDDLNMLPGPRGLSLEPGHMAEWVWLLGRYGRLTGADVQPLQRTLMAGALRFALPSGFLPDEVSLDGRILRATRRTWPQTELLKAELAMLEAGAGAQASVRAAEKRLMGYVRAPYPAGWIDRFDAAGAPVAGPTPASTLYHLFWAITERRRVLGGVVRQG
ncbi:MAG: AGE family epimerase/isomerase [Alphaproteobacteria bacterium]|nr:AGE family epimerase/isomerase [Alphaproteobacteria bacterium]